MIPRRDFCEHGYTRGFCEVCMRITLRWGILNALLITACAGVLAYACVADAAAAQEGCRSYAVHGNGTPTENVTVCETYRYGFPPRPAPVFAPLYPPPAPSPAVDWDALAGALRARQAGAVPARCREVGIWCDLGP
jgi:hypothetical protein